MDIHREDTAIVFIDPQNDVLSEKGLSWPLVRESLQENNTMSLHRRWKNHCRRPSSRVGARDQRSRSTAPQTLERG